MEMKPIGCGTSSSSPITTEPAQVDESAQQSKLSVATITSEYGGISPWIIAPFTKPWNPRNRNLH
jgi:hypothetical protein